MQINLKKNYYLCKINFKKFEKYFTYVKFITIIDLEKKTNA